MSFQGFKWQVIWVFILPGGNQGSPGWWGTCKRRNLQPSPPTRSRSAPEEQRKKVSQGFTPPAPSAVHQAPVNLPVAAGLPRRSWPRRWRSPARGWRRRRRRRRCGGVWTVNDSEERSGDQETAGRGENCVAFELRLSWSFFITSAIVPHCSCVFAAKSMTARV